MSEDFLERIQRRPLETYQRAPATADDVDDVDDETATAAADDDDDDDEADSNMTTARSIFRNFLGMSLLFSANHGCVVACLSLATARLGGTLGNWQSGVLYLTYTGSALFGATLLTKKLGPRLALVTGMALYCFYVGAFWIGTLSPAGAAPAALLGGMIGGVGAGVLWTAQGAFFARAAEQHAHLLGQPSTESTKHLAGVFAFFYLALELGLRSLSSVLLQFTGTPWSTIFGIYFAVAVCSTVGLYALVQDPPVSLDEAMTTLEHDHNNSNSNWYEITAAFQLLRRDRKMQYMIGLNAVFGFTSAFLNSYVNGQVVRDVLHDDDSKNLGLLTAWVSAVAAAMSLIFARLKIDKGIVLTIGALCFLGVALPFMISPPFTTNDSSSGTVGSSVPSSSWGLWTLVVIYTLHGTGRATFESTLKGTFADFFAQEKEGAFANIILQNGLSSALGFVITNWTCQPGPSTCLAFHDGTYHDPRILEWMIVGSAVAAVTGYWRAARIHHQQTEESYPSVWTLVENHPGTAA